MATAPSSPPAAPPSAPAPAAPRSWVARWLGYAALTAVGGALSVAMIGGMAAALIYNDLPSVDDLADFRPKLPLRIYTADGALLREFGEERREFTPFDDIPPVMVNAVLAIEDAHFFEHHGVDWAGMARAFVANLGKSRSQGASTVTMQVARNVYLSNEKSYVRKLYEVMMTFKLEHTLSKEQILEIYMNQIFLGNRAYGFAAASQTYFGKPLKQLSIAEAAMLAGLPKAPSAYNPFSNPKRARIRQQYIIERMAENGYITDAQAAKAKAETLHLRKGRNATEVPGEYVAEMARLAVYEQFGPEAYTRGLQVYTTVMSQDQTAAYQAVRKGLITFESRQHYRGPEAFIDLPSLTASREQAIEDALLDYPDEGELISGVVLSANPQLVKVALGAGQIIVVKGEGLKPVESGLRANAPDNLRLRPGAVVRVYEVEPDQWRLTQIPEVQSAFVALNPNTGGIQALVGGFDFTRNKFNHATQSWRQPGSSIKPFIISASLEMGFGPATLVPDEPLFFSAEQTGSDAWEPKNYDGKFDGPLTLQEGLARSKNMVSIRVLNAIGPAYAQQWLTRFGFEAKRHPAYLTMALGAGAVTPLQMASAYGVFANGGHYLAPMLITKITDNKGQVLRQFAPETASEANQVIPARNAFLMGTMLNEITRSGTAARAQATLKRPDLYGKTGTTNKAFDAWFLGYQPDLVAAVWVGYDQPRNLGSRETGGGLSLPIWLDYMGAVLPRYPVRDLSQPDGVMRAGNFWYYDDFGPGKGIANLADGQKAGTLPGGATVIPPLAPQDRKEILDLFKGE